MDVFNIALSVFSLTILEIILGIDNLIFLAILTDKLPLKDRKRARYLGLSFAWITRLILLGSAVWLTHFKDPIVFIDALAFSIRDIFLMLGGAFLIYKATEEIGYELVEKELDLEEDKQHKAKAFKMVVMQVAVMDIIFSLDSVLTAVGLTSDFFIMATAISIAILIMIFASSSVCSFIEKNPTVKMLALCFLILIGTLLIADSFQFHIPRGYLYFAMLFSMSIEALNMIKRKRSKHRR
jgi:predicted tellurium resistance membrane protein TerC